MALNAVNMPALREDTTPYRLDARKALGGCRRVCV